MKLMYYLKMSLSYFLTFKIIYTFQKENIYISIHIYKIL